MKKREWTLEFPEILKFWDFEKNVKKPEDTRTYERVWWICEHKHSYCSSIMNRIARKSFDCWYCKTGHRTLSEEHNFFIKHPDLMKEWDFEKNKDVDPKKIHPRISKKVWWKCSKGHSFQQTILSRTKNKSKCPYCMGSKPSEENNFGLHILSKDFHPNKNGILTPRDFTLHSTKSVWFLCPIGHEYKAKIHTKTTHNTKCPFCNPKYSTIELWAYVILKNIFEEVLWRHKINGLEVDIFIPKFKLGVEIDGSYWHKNRIEKDLNKNHKMCEKGIFILRMREEPLLRLFDLDITFKSPYNYLEIMKNLISRISEITHTNMDFFLSLNELPFTKEYDQMRSEIERPKKNCVDVFPDIVKWWHPTKNAPLKPENFSYQSSQKVWFLCPEKNHEFFSKISNRVRKHGCPICHKAPRYIHPLEEK